jgi:hypothetical protein
VPLLGEPTVQLPKNVCVDLASSQIPGAGGDGYRIMFTPNGQVKNATAAQYFLWIRDYTKAGGQGGNDAQGGEQQVVAVKTMSGSLGMFPIAWQPDDPFKFAKLAASSP